MGAWLGKDDQDFDWDAIIIGGGSGGIACAKQCARYGKKILLCDYVKPSPLGVRWGLGGTCVNVGCIPKKLMHHASLLDKYMKDATAFGWSGYSNPKHEWPVMVERIQNYIHYLNFAYRLNLSQNGVVYQNGFCEFISDNPHVLEYTDRQNQRSILTGRYIIIAVGGRPKYLEIPGGRAEDKICITSDEMFSLQHHPGKVVIVGGSYIALECAGFLSALGCSVTILVRDVLLRNMDRGVVEYLTEDFESKGITILLGWSPVEVKRVKEGNPQELVIAFREQKTGELRSMSANTVLLAVGREPNTKDVRAKRIGLKMDSLGKLVVDKGDQTNVKMLYAIGDCASQRPELTPPAARAGLLLADRLFGGKRELMDYTNIPTTVFTPTEYGFVGMTEEAAIQKHGAKNVEVYHAARQPLEFSLSERDSDTCYCKIVCLKSGKQKVLGFHYCGPHAGEVIQGFAAALKLKVTKADLDSTVGIHPTCAEQFTTLTTTKSSGISYKKTSC